MSIRMLEAPCLSAFWRYVCPRVGDTVSIRMLEISCPFACVVFKIRLRANFGDALYWGFTLTGVGEILFSFLLMMTLKSVSFL